MALLSPTMDIYRIINPRDILQMWCRHPVILVTGLFLLQYLRKLRRKIFITDISWQDVSRQNFFDIDQYFRSHSAWISKKMR